MLYLLFANIINENKAYAINYLEFLIVCIVQVLYKNSKLKIAKTVKRYYRCLEI